VISTPAIPGLELVIPAGAIVTGPDGKLVTRIGITPLPLDRTPFRCRNTPSSRSTLPRSRAVRRISSVDGKWIGAQLR